MKRLVQKLLMNDANRTTFFKEIRENKTTQKK